MSYKTYSTYNNTLFFTHRLQIEHNNKAQYNKIMSDSALLLCYIGTVLVEFLD